MLDTAHGADHSHCLLRVPVQVKPDDGLQFFRKLRILAEFERPHQVRLEAVAVPNSPDRRLAHGCRRSHGSRAPVGGVGGLLLGGLLDDLLHLGGRYRSRPARSRRVFFKSGEAAVDKPIAPSSHLLRRDPEFGGDLLVLQALGGPQDDPGAFHVTERQGSGARLLFQDLSLFGAQCDGASYAHPRPPL